MPPPRPIPPPPPPLSPLTGAQAVRLPAWPLPPYRYVPGLSPHPFRHPDGHMFTDGRPPKEDPAQVPRLWLRGLDLYDQRFYWEAHEAWEACWHHTPPGPWRLAQQALIQGAAAVLKRHLGHSAAAQRLHQAAQERFAQAIALQGDPVLKGVDLEGTRAELRAALEDDQRWPRIISAP